MAEDDRTRRWQRLDRPAIERDPLQVLRAAVAEVRAAPRDDEARRRLRAIAAEQGTWEQLAVLLADEAGAAANRPELAAAFYEELADVHENLDQPLETIAAMEAVVTLVPDDPEHHDRLARLYHREGAWAKAAAAFERVADLARDDRGRAALRAAARLYRDHGKLEQAVAAYRAVVERRANDVDAWRALEELLHQLGRWRELATVRGELATRSTGVEKAILLRGQARALEQLGETAAAAELVTQAAHHAPEDVSGIVDYASVLARDGRAREAAAVLAQRIDQSVADGAPPDSIAAMRLRLAAILDEACDDRAAAIGVLEELLGDAPTHLAALDRLVALLAAEPDRRLLAAALARRAAALPAGTDRANALVDAARCYREAGDLAAAVRALEEATEHTDDREQRAELDDVRTAAIVARAADDARAGNRDGAERRLRTILDRHPTSIEANLALADLLSPAAAAEHLRGTLADAPADTPHPRLARLVHRYARAMAELGEPDDAHNLLHEAHRLDRKSLAITLALGDSCFARRLWREAAIHLGSLADHPDAPAHATDVAAALVRAAQAEARALRPANAEKRYEAAVRIDPRCARAWRALADIATERGDRTRAVECLEREAAAITDPRERVRRYDALARTALDSLGDAAMAERCWREVLDDADAPTIEKLLALQRRRGATSERGETCERLAALVERPKDLWCEAAEAYAAGGEHARARAVAERLIAAHGLDIDAVSAASTVALASGDHDRAATWLRRALGAWDAAERSTPTRRGGDTRPPPFGPKGLGDPARRAIERDSQEDLTTGEIPRADGTDDPRRAELWRRLGDAERGRGNDGGAVTAFQRAIAASPESDAALAARRALVELATISGAEPASQSLAELVEAEQRPDDILAYARQLARTERVDDARAMFELARALGVELRGEDEQFLDDHPPRAMASDEAYATTLDDATRRALIDDPADQPLRDLFALLGEAANLVCPDARTALADAALSDATRLSGASAAAAAAMFPQIAKALAGPQTLLYGTTSPAYGEITLLLAAPPVIVLGPRLASVRARSHTDADHEGDAELRFRLGRVVELARPHRIFTAYPNFPRLVRALAQVAGRDSGEPAEAERLRAALPVQLRRRLAEALAALGPATALDPDLYLAACERAADRAGLIVCGNLTVALEHAGLAPHLVRLAASSRYLALRSALQRGYRTRR